ncbi:MAG: HTH domain-containing protein, partial [Actinomycetota bacterium]
MQRLERLFAINDTLRRAAPHRVSAAKLAEEFDVSRRTIERDLASLRAAGVPLYAERGRTGGQV